ncbi:MAG: single-stranded DNA-binding protein [Treponema sp.]|jgi:single-strand DNA-binding protein|nr:single-stranded DNA-binding protein [Treponema sp.]
MADLNHVTLIGRLTRDAELKYTSGGQAVCKFSIAVNRRRKNGDQWEDEPNFFDIVLWGRQGESLNQYLVKGKMIGVDGELRQDRWQQDGQNRSKVEIVANNLQLLGGSASSPSGSYGGSGGSSSGASGGGSYSQQPRPEFSAGVHAENRPDDERNGSAPASDGFADDIPF